MLNFVSQLRKHTSRMSEKKLHRRIFRTEGVEDNTFQNKEHHNFYLLSIVISGMASSGGHLRIRQLNFRRHRRNF
jgi:hypothetical protein